MNIYLRELRANLKSLLIWSTIMIVIIFMMMSEFEAYYNNPEMMSILDAMPESLMKAFSFSGVNITTLSGFLSMASIYFYLMLTVFASLLGNSIISKEERDKTAEFLMTMPISRPHMLTAKIFAAITYNLILNLITFGTVLIASLKYDPDSEFLKFSLLMMSAVFLLQLVFSSMGMLFASVLKNPRKSGTIAIVVLLIMYVFSIAVSLSDSIEFIKFASPYTYFEPNYLLVNDRLNNLNIILSAGFILTGVIVTYTFYPKRDLQI